MTARSQSRGENLEIVHIEEHAALKSEFEFGNRLRRRVENDLLRIKTGPQGLLEFAYRCRLAAEAILSCFLRRS